MRIKSQKKQMNSLSHISNKIITILDFWENQPPFFAVGSMIWLSSVEEVPGLGCSHKPRVSDHSVDLWIVDHIYCCLSKRFKLNICWLCCLKNHDDSIVIWYVMMWRFRVVFHEFRNTYFWGLHLSLSSRMLFTGVRTSTFSADSCWDWCEKSSFVEVPDVEVAFTIGILQLFWFSPVLRGKLKFRNFSKPSGTSPFLKGFSDV